MDFGIGNNMDIYEPEESEITKAQAVGKLPVGRPKGKSPVTILKEEMYNCVSVDDFKKITMLVLNKAKNGNEWAIDFIFDRLIGKPKQEIEQTIHDSNIKTYINIDIDKV